MMMFDKVVLILSHDVVVGGDGGPEWQINVLTTLVKVMDLIF